MTFHNRKGVIPYWEKIPLSALAGRGTKLPLIVLVAMGIAFLLSLPGVSVWAWHQSPVFPVSPEPTQTDQSPTLSPTAPVITSTPAAEPAADSQKPNSSERGTALLVAGGIVLAGLIVGVAVLLLEGVMSS